MGSDRAKMKKGTKSNLCPLCGRQKKVETKRSRTNIRAGLTSVFKKSLAEAELLKLEYSDDNTANGFAAFLLRAQKERGGV